MTFIHASNLLPSLPTPLPYNSNNVHALRVCMCECVCVYLSLCIQVNCVYFLYMCVCVCIKYINIRVYMVHSRNLTKWQNSDSCGWRECGDLVPWPGPTLGSSSSFSETVSHDSKLVIPKAKSASIINNHSNNVHVVSVCVSVCI